MAETEELVHAYWQYHALSAGGREDRLAALEWFWAWESVHDAVRERPTEALAIVEALVETAAADADLDYLGAGPLEDLLRDHGLVLLDPLDVLARRDPRFRRALNAVWLSEDVPLTVRQWLELFRGGAS